MNDIAKPLITTIIPTYCRPKLLRRAIKSVLNQTYPHFQVCVYDNASGDETADVVAEFAKKDSRVKYYCHPENIGAIKNFNYGMKHIETPFFSFLSDDDILLPEFYQTALLCFQKYPEVMFSSSATAYMDYSGHFLSSFSFALREGLYKPPQGMIEMIKHRYDGIWTGMLFRKEVIEKIGFVDEEVGNYSDPDFVLRVTAHFPFAISSKKCGILFVNRLLGNEMRRFDFTWPGYLKMISNITEDESLSSNVRSYIKQILTEQLKKRLFQVGIASIIRKNFNDTYQAANVLNYQYHWKIKAFFLSTLAKICQHFYPAYYCIFFLDKIRRDWQRYKLRHLQKEYWNYVHSLE